MRRSDSILNSCSACPRSGSYGGPKVGITGAVRSNFALKARRPGTEFLDAETGHQKSSRKSVNTCRDQSSGIGRPKSPQKRPIWRRIGNVRFAETGWWCAQSDANPSPCYLANIRVIFENNSEPVAKKAKRPCGAGTSDHRANFDNREKQGGSLQSNTVLPAKSRERKDRAAKPPTSPASRLHGCPRLPPHTTRLVL